MIGRRKEEVIWLAVAAAAAAARGEEFSWGDFSSTDKGTTKGEEPTTDRRTTHRSEERGVK